MADEMKEFRAMLISDLELKTAIDVLGKFYNAQKSERQNWYPAYQVGIKEHEEKYINRLLGAGILRQLLAGLYPSYRVTDEGKKIYEQLINSMQLAEVH